MSHLEYYNSLATVIDTFYESHSELIKSLCKEFDAEDRTTELTEKYLNKLKVKAKKDPDAPKKWRSSYILFCNEKRQSIDTKGKKMKDVQRELAAAWKKLSEEDKQKYTELAEDDKKRYEKERRQYEEKLYN